MISRDTAIESLKQMNYERFSIAPSISGYRRGISMNIYFAVEASKVYPYGTNGKVDGYIAPAKYRHNHRKIKEIIGYHGNIVVLDSKGNVQ